MYYLGLHNLAVSINGLEETVLDLLSNGAEVAVSKVTDHLSGARRLPLHVRVEVGHAASHAWVCEHRCADGSAERNSSELHGEL